MRADGELTSELERHRPLLWKLLYRMTGSSADAEDLVQETFARALERPPPDVGLPIRPWLVRVALNLGRDSLRRRKLRPYVGPWLPAPAPIDDSPQAAPPDDHYDLAESATFAFLIALEALTPSQRAVLLLRDVFDYSVQEAALALGISETNVKTLHHRARSAMSRYDAARKLPDRSLVERTRGALGSLMAAIATGDAEAIKTLCAADVTLLTDGGGEYLAALRPIHGPDKVARFFLKLSVKYGLPSDVRFTTLNGLPAIVAEFENTPPRISRRSVMRGELGPDGKLTELHVVLASAKLLAVH